MEVDTVSGLLELRRKVVQLLPNLNFPCKLTPGRHVNADETSLRGNLS